MIWFITLGLGIGIISSYKAYNFIKYDAHRPMITFASEKYSHPLHIAEIGVFYGTNARRMFKKLHVNKMFLIDPFQKNGEYKEKNVLRFLPSSFKPALWLLKKYNDKIVTFKMTSEDAAPHVPENLDMVYIDGNHEYEFVKKDIELYYPKVKTGGIIGGHDIEGNANVDVRKAVFEFAEKNDLSVQVNKPDWWIVKK